MKKYRLVRNWKSFPRWYSFWANTVLASFLTTWALLPEKLQDAIPLGVMVVIALTFLVLGTLGRLVDQGTDQGKDNDHHQDAT